jgi:hypothetical protein
VGEIEDAHHAEDQREPGAEHEQQQAVADAVQQRYGEELHPLGFFSGRCACGRILPGAAAKKKPGR